jgi:type I restriction enzyme S subunit
MIDGLKPYPEYKESGLPWLGRFPAHWELIPNRALMQEQRKVVGEKAADYTLLSLTLGGIIPRNMETPKGKFPAQFNTYKVVRPDDLVFCLFDIDETPRGVGHSKLNGMITGAYDVFSPRPRANARYLYLYYLFIDEGKRLKPLYTGLRKTIRPGDFASLKTPCPEPDEQDAIVRFLDHANGRIERAIRAKQKLMALLNEQKQAIIHRAVTRGLNPNVPLKPSGIPWLGDIPKHWEVKKLRLLFRYAKGSRAAELTNEYIGRNAGPFPVYSGQTEGGGLMGKVIWHEFDFDSPVVFVSTVGARAMSTRLVRGKFSLSQNCALIIPRTKEANPDFFESVFQRLFDYERASISLIMQPSLRFADLNRFYVPHPPLPEQLAIVEALSTKVTELEQIKNRTEREIGLLREYRTRLVADVVTGKLDVRPAARQLPAKVVDPEAESANTPDEADQPETMEENDEQ